MEKSACPFWGMFVLLPEIADIDPSVSTWAGERGEQWSSAQGLESILISIQSLLSANPYENEPGYENAKGSESQKEMAAYVAKVSLIEVYRISLTRKIRHETLRIAVMHPLELSLGIRRDGSVVPRSTKRDEEELLLEEERGPDPFADLRKRRFLWYFESYMHSIDTAGQAITRTQFFERMPFENRGNTMDGHFDYPELKRRFTLIWNTLMNETKSWAVEGLEVNKQEIGIAVSLRRQYEQIVEDLKRQKNFTVDLSLVDDNPFVWQLTYFGRPMTHLDGGIFKIRIHLSPRFPEEQPRVFMQTPLFHLRLSKHGVLCYCLERAEEMRHHVEAIVSALEDESPPYDPRMTVNAEASKLFWGSPDERKQYNRALRRSVERSAE